MISELKADMVRIYSQQLGKLVGFQHCLDQVVRALPLAGETTDDDEEFKDQADELAWMIHDGIIAHNCTAVRKAVDQNPDSVSLVNVLKKLKERLPEVSRSAFQKSYSDAVLPLDVVDKDYDVVTGGQPELTAEMIDDDIEKLIAVTKPVKKLTNKVIAHTDRKFSGVMSYLELRDAIDCLKETYNRYALLVDCGRINDDETAEHFNISRPLARIWQKRKRTADDVE